MPAVVEGVGDHGCEYMTAGCGGTVLGHDRSRRAGRVGGIAYVLTRQVPSRTVADLAQVALEKVLPANRHAAGHSLVSAEPTKRGSRSW